MIYILLNAGPILLGTLAGLAAGLLFLRLFGTPLPRAPVLAVLALAEAWLAAILAGALILAPDEAPPLVMALLTPVVIWAGFVLPAVAATHALRGARARLALLDPLHWLLVMLVQAAVFVSVGLVPPPR